jgi:organic hydroperoxide reductase OsmC/OhrA
MSKQHHYTTHLQWTGNQGEGTTTYQSYTRDHTINVDGKCTELLLSADPNFRGDAARYNPEELFLASISACHMLWYLHLCAVNGIVVEVYEDQAKGTMTEEQNGSGRFTAVALYPSVTIRSADHQAKAIELHHEANNMCFIANSCNFAIEHKVTIRIAAAK